MNDQNKNNNKFDTASNLLGIVCGILFLALGILELIDGGYLLAALSVILAVTSFLGIVKGGNFVIISAVISVAAFIVIAVIQFISAHYVIAILSLIVAVLAAVNLIKYRK